MTRRRQRELTLAQTLELLDWPLVTAWLTEREREELEAELGTVIEQGQCVRFGSTERPRWVCVMLRRPRAPWRVRR